MRYMPEITGRFWSVGFFTPQREQAKTNRDRLVSHLHATANVYGFEIMEANSNTIRIGYRKGKEVVVTAECFVFCVSPTSHPESKTLDMAIVEESHKINDDIFKNDIRPMLASTNGSVIWTGVAGTRRCHFKDVMDKPLAYLADVDKVIADKERAFKETGDSRHLNYKAFIAAELDKLKEEGGRTSVPFKINYLLKWALGKGQFVTTEKIESLRYATEIDLSKTFEWIAFGLDHARNVDRTWIIAIGKMPEWDKPRVIFVERLARMDYDAQAEIVVKRLSEFQSEEFMLAVDCTGQGDFMADLIEKKSGRNWRTYDDKTGGNMVRFKFTQQGKDETGTLLKQCFTYGLVEMPPRGATASDEAIFESELCDLELHMNGSFITWHAPATLSRSTQPDNDEEEAHDDAAATFMLALVAQKRMKEKIVPRIR